MSSEQRHKILVVDDDRVHVESLIKIFNTLYTVLVANDGKRGIKIATESLPDLILLDVIMPDMSGFAVLDELRRADATRTIPVIVITALSSQEDEEKAFTHGAVDYITKPFNPTIVEARVRIHIQMLEQLQTIERLSRVDVLTNLHNRRSLNELLEREWSRAVRDKTAISLLMIDVDRFKNYNDTFGHIQGDVALQTVAGVFLGALRRPADAAGRWGGEEFVVLLPGTGLVGATKLAEQIRTAVENTAIYTDDGTHTSVTVSIGVHTLRPKSGSSVDLLLSGSDNALYSAKAAGRNKVCVFSGT